MQIPRDIIKNIKNFNFIGAKNYGFAHYKQSDKDFIKQEVFMQYNTLIFVLKGSKVIYHTNSHTTIKEKEAIFVPKGKYILSDILDFKDKEYQSLLFFFSDFVLNSFANKYHHLIQSTSKGDEDIFKIQMDSFLCTLFESFIPLTQVANHTSLLSLKYEEIFLYLLQDTKNKARFLGFLNNFLETNTLNLGAFYIQNQEYCNVSDMANDAKMDNASFSRKFKDVLGISPKEWLDNKRFEKACFMLEFSSKNITQISQELGFNSPAWFIERFKKRFGITPKQFQKSKNLYFLSQN